MKKRVMATTVCISTKVPVMVLYGNVAAPKRKTLLSEVLLVDEIARKFPSSGRVYTSSSVSTLLNSAAGHS